MRLGAAHSARTHCSGVENASGPGPCVL